MDAYADSAVPLSTAIISASFVTNALHNTPFANLRQEQLAILLYAISVCVTKTRYLQFPDGFASKEWYHMSNEGLVMLPANVSFFFFFVY